MAQSKEYHINNATIRVIFGNILDSRAEVIADSCGSKLTMSGGLTGAIREAGGEVIREDAQRKLPVNIGDAVVTTAGRLPQKYVFHCITIDKSPDHSNTPDGVSGEDIQQYIIGHSIDKCFQLLNAMDLQSIAFPAIGSGNAGIPIEKVSAVMSEAIARNLRKTNKPMLVEVYLYDGGMDRWRYLSMFERFSAQEALSGLMREQAYDSLSMEGGFQPVPGNLAPDMDKDVFISYSRKDSEIVKPVYEQLEKAGIKCWLDVDGMYSGVSFKKVIVDAIKRCKVLLFMSSVNSNKSRNVVSEVSLAMEYGKKVIPVRLDMSPYADSIQYDIINHDFVIYDTYKADASFGEMLKRIVSTLEIQ